MTYEFDPNMKPQLLRCNEAYLLGTLAVHETFFPGGEDNAPITLMKNSNAVMFFIKPLSEEPSPIIKYFQRYSGIGNLYIGIDIDQPSSVIKDAAYPYKSTNEKIDFWRDKLEGKLVLFKPKIKFSKTRQPYLNLEIVAIEGEMEDLSEQQFICIPKVSMNQETFESKLLGGHYLTFEDYQHFYQNPAYVICGDYLYFNFQGWEKHSDLYKAWRVAKEPEKIMKIRLDFNNHEFSSYVVSGTDYLQFINDYGDMQLNDCLYDLGATLVSEGVNSSAPTPTPTSPTMATSTKATPISSIPTSTSNLTSSEEMEFIQELELIAHKNSLTYNPMDLVNFHVSVKTNPLTVVAGMSGTGKTQLAAKVYAKALGLSEEDGTLLFLPICPSYLEPSDLLGYHNPSTGLYVPSETGLVDLLVRAEKDPDCFYMVVFDEMNLSQVEYWFAPFLSLLELDSEERRLKLYGKDVICHNSAKYNHSVKIGDNVIFVGTVNLDETTKGFSDRLLDRVNVVTLQKAPFTQLQLIQPSKDYVEKTYTYTQFKQWINFENGVKAYTETDLEFFDALHELINRYDSQKGVSYRLLERVGRYINNLPVATDSTYTISRETAIDLGIKQRLLTKIKGTDREIGSLVGTTMTPKQEPQDSELLEFFNGEQAQRVSSFDYTKKELMKKALELGVHGYTN